MLKIIFLHGLESTNKSSKVRVMRSLGHDVVAPEMDYKTNPDLFQTTLSLIKDFQPELIVGSSMGGYFAYHLGTHFNANLLLLNPALPRRSFNPEVLSDGKEKPNIWALLGSNDIVVPPDANRSILERLGAKITVGDHGHRTPKDVFEAFFNEVLNEI